MKLPDVQEVREATSPHAANILLGQGWQLLAIHPTRSPYCAAVYILGARTHTDDPASVPTLSDAPPQA